MPPFPAGSAELAPKVEALLHWCEVEGRDPDKIERGLGIEPCDLDMALAEDADAYVELGFTQFTLGFNGPEWDVASGRPWLEWRDGINR